MLSGLALFAVATAALILAVGLIGQSEAVEFRGYLLLLVAGPFAAALAWAGLEHRLGAASWARASRRVVQLAAGLLLLLALAGLVAQLVGLAILQPLLILLLAVFLGLATLVPAGRLPQRLDRLLTRGEAWTLPALAAGLLLFCLVYSPLYPAQPAFSAVVDWASQRPLFVLLLVAAWPLAFLLPRLPAVRGGPGAWVLLALALVFALLLFDDGLFRDFKHFIAYVDPALHARHGGIPLVEVYSQYGTLPFVVLDLAFGWLPESFGSAALVFRLFTVAWYVVFLLTVYRLVEDKAVALALAAVGLVWNVTFHAGLFNLGGLPSTQGYRYLVPSLMVLWLAWAPRGALRWLGVAAVAGLASLYSLESWLFALGPALAAGFLESLRGRRAGPLLGDLGATLVGSAGAQALLAGYLSASYGRLPDYAPYLEILTNFQPGERSDWGVPIDPYFGLWVPAAAACFLVLALATHDALRRRVEHPRAWSLVPAAVLAVGEISYFVGRSSSTTLGLALLPLLVVVLVGFDALLERWRAARTGSRELRWERGLLALAVAAVFAFSIERFARPYDPSKGNASILRRCFDESGCAPAAVLARLRSGVEERAVDMRQDDPRHHELDRTDLLPRLRELEGLLAAHFPPAGRIAAPLDSERLPWIGGLLFAGSPHWYLGPVSSPLNDMSSPTLTQRIVDTARMLQPGDRLLLDRAPETLLPVWRDWVAALEARCRLDPVDGGVFYQVVRVDACTDS